MRNLRWIAGVFNVLTVAALLATTAITDNAHAQLARSDFDLVVTAFHQEYDEELALVNARFDVNGGLLGAQDFWWDLPQWRAAYASYTDPVTGAREHYLRFMGGYRRDPEISVDATILTLCHEFGHGIAGPPLKDDPFKEGARSIEAMADDYAARTCFRRVAGRVPQTATEPANPHAAKLCRDRAGKELLVCWRFFKALDYDRHYYLNNPEIAEDSAFEKQDSTVVTAVNTTEDYYPPAQCRIDTSIAAFFGDERPRCWWPR